MSPQVFLFLSGTVALIGLLSLLLLLQTKA